MQTAYTDSLNQDFMATNHADASGLTSSNPWAGVDGDGATELALAAPSQGQDAVRRLMRLKRWRNAPMN